MQTERRSGQRASIEGRIRRLFNDAAEMWREAYGEHLTNDDCDALTRRLLALFRIELVQPSGPRNRGFSVVVPTETMKKYVKRF